MHVVLLALALAASPLKPISVTNFPVPSDAKVVRADPAAKQSLRLGLVLQDCAGLEALIAAQRDPRSPQFRRWLTPDEFGARFGVPASSYDQLAKLLAHAGLELRRSPNRLFLEGEGRVAQVEKLLGIELVEVTAGAQHFRTFRGTPRLPDELAGLIQSVSGLDNRVRMHPRLNAGGNRTFGPQDLRRYYHIDALHQAGYAGQLSRVAVLGDIPDSANYPSAADITWFYRNVSDSSANLVIDDLGLGSSQADSQQGVKVELEMDAELSTVAAPQEREVVLVLAPGDSLFTSGMNEIVNHLSDVAAVSISFGTCELLEKQYGALEMQTTQNLVEQGVAEGIAWFSASGDDGVVTCYRMGDPNTQNKPSVDFPSALPYMTAVGGTMYTGGFDANDAISAYGSETTWNEYNQAAGGGGVSTVYARPAWQVGPGTSDGGFREVPDIALLSAMSPGVAIVSTKPGQIDPYGSGTSDAAPMAAGMFALINDRIGGCRFGSPNAVLYALGAAQYGGTGAQVFHDITTGNIGVDGVVGPSATVAYDEATGLGSLDVTALANAWPPCAALDPDAGAPDAGYLVWNGGDAQDAGPRAAFDACAVIGCTGTSVCNTTTEGPSACVAACDPNAGNTCAPGEYCQSGACTPGCRISSDCGSGNTCLACAASCVPAGNANAGPGSPCTSSADCQTGGQCITEQQGLAGGYCTSDCSGACGCASGSTCWYGQYCMQSCTISTQQGCRSGYVCDPVDASDQGVCLPDCRTIGNQCFTQNESCRSSDGICAPPGWTMPTGSSSGSSSSSSSSSGSTSTTGSSGTSTSGSTSGGATSTGATSSSSGGSGASSGGSKPGSGCGSVGMLDGFWPLVVAIGAWMSRRRVR